MFVTSTVLAITLSLPAQFGRNGPTVSGHYAARGDVTRNYGTTAYSYYNPYLMFGYGYNPYMMYGYGYNPLIMGYGYNPYGYMGVPFFYSSGYGGMGVRGGGMTSGHGGGHR